MKTFESISRLFVPQSVVTETDKQLRRAGVQGLETFVLWSGTREQKSFRVHTLHIPRQTSYRFDDGLCVRINGDELHRLNVWLFENEEELAVQVHSHPTDAYHSDTDDTYPIVTTLGGLSIVVPDFGKEGLRGPGVAYYRLTPSGWLELSAKQASELVELEE